MDSQLLTEFLVRITDQLEEVISLLKGGVITQGKQSLSAKKVVVKKVEEESDLAVRTSGPSTSKDGGLSSVLEPDWSTSKIKNKGADLDAVKAEINLEYWFKRYDEEAKPAKLMFVDQVEWPPTKEESELMSTLLKELDGTRVNDTHIFRYLGKGRYDRTIVNLFACVPG